MNLKHDRQKLEAWLREAGWARRQRAEDPAEHHPLPAVELSGPPAAEGQIRLWPAAEAEDEPVYALVMPGEYGHWLLIPFGPFAAPATPEEGRLRERPPAQVLQFWNRRRVPRARVEVSWCAETLDAEELRLVRAWLLQVQGGAALPAEVCGPPLPHPLDPRHDYLDGEAARVTRALGEVFALAAEDETALRLAAEPENGDLYL